MEKNPDHSSNIKALRRIEGQVRGIEAMIERGEYCIDILRSFTLSGAAGPWRSNP